MTAITARVAGVHTVIVASPRPAAITIGAAFVAGADALLTVGGAQAIAALAYGTESIAYPLYSVFQRYQICLVVQVLVKCRPVMLLLGREIDG
jgi:hypothetical protein